MLQNIFNLLLKEKTGVLVYSLLVRDRYFKIMQQLIKTYNLIFN